jgi:hypothetical protein
MVPQSTYPVKSHFQKRARFFRVHEDVTIIELGEWYAQGNPAKNRKHSESTIAEVEGK